MSVVDRPFEAPQAVQSWERRARVRALLMADATGKMLDAAGIESGSWVLDVGTGTADTALLAAQRVRPTGRVIAIDASAPMVEQSASNVRKSGLTNIDVRLMDGAQLQLDDASVDAVIGRNAMQFLPGWPEPLNGFHRVLRPGGRLAFIVWAPKEFNRYFHLPIAVAQEHGWMRLPATALEMAYRLDDAHRLRADLQAACFRDVAVDRVVAEVRMADGAALVNYLREGPMFRNNYDQLDDSERTAFDLALEAAFERFRDGDTYRIQATALLATGTR